MPARRVWQRFASWLARAGPLGVVAALPWLAASTLFAQPVRAPAAATRHVPGDTATRSVLRGGRVVSLAMPTSGSSQARLARSAPWWSALASAAIPGVGQAVLRQPRGVIYAATEAYMWLEYREATKFTDQQRDGYRRIARDIARRRSTGTRPDGDSDYYEILERLCTITFTYGTRCPSSGLYDVAAGGEVDPETDITTYNGQTWAKARDIYWTNRDAPTPAEYNNALAYYQRRAIRPEFYWSWIDQQQAQDEYRRRIAAANAAKRDATRNLQFIAANHVLSMVDAFVTVRIRRYGGANGGPRRSGFEAAVPWAPFGRRAR